MPDPHAPLKALLSITYSRYEPFYEPLYPNLKNWIEKNVQDLTPELKVNRLQKIWDNGIDMLKIRRGYLLPFGTDAETCYREQALWSYAVFTAALIDGLKKHFDVPVPDVTVVILPASGLGWLKSHASIFTPWSAYLQENDKKTVFSILAKQLCRLRRAQVAEKNAKNNKVSIKTR